MGSWSLRFITLSRPLTLVACMTVFILDSRASLPSLALYVISAAFFIASSAIANGWVHTDYRIRLGVIWAKILLITYLNWHGLYYFSSLATMAAFMVVTVSIPLGLERHHWRSAFAALFTAWFATAIVGLGVATGEWATSVFTALIFAGAMLFFASNGVLMVSLREEKNRSERLLQEVTESRAAFDRAHRQLQETAAQQQHLAVLEERQRLAREIHDSVAHLLTALVVQTQAARKLLTRDVEKVSESLAYCEQMARDALLETRRAVRALHPAGLEQVTLVEALQRLARDYGVATGAPPLRLRCSPERPPNSCSPSPTMEYLPRAWSQASV